MNSYPTKLKVVSIVGTRPEIIKLSCIFRALDNAFDHTIIHTGQNYDYELNQIFFDELGIRTPDIQMNVEPGNPSTVIGQILMLIDDVLCRCRPDAALILGDTNSALAAIALKKHKIPIFHIEAGNRCFDERVPEEVNRRIVDHISDVNLTYTDLAKNYLISEGLKPDYIIKIGSPMKEVLDYYMVSIQNSTILEKLKIEPKKYFLLSLHREENVDSPQILSIWAEIIESLAQKYKIPVFFSCHPRTQNRLNHLNLKFSSQIVQMRPLSFFDYVNMQLNALVVLSDSGTITEESSILGFPALNLRDTHERPEGMEEASVIMTGVNKDSVLESVNYLLTSSTLSKPVICHRDYTNENISTKVVRIILSYTRLIKARLGEPLYHNNVVESTSS